MVKFKKYEQFNTLIKNIVYFLFSTLIFSCQNTTNSKQSNQPYNKADSSKKHTFWILGELPDFHTHYGEEAVANKYVFSIIHAGCVLNDSLDSIINTNNSKLIYHLRKTHPNITIQQIHEEINDYALKNKSIELVVRHVFEKRLSKKEFYKNLQLKWQPAQESGWYVVEIFTFETDNYKKLNYITTMKINPETKDYMLQDDKGNWIEI